MMRAAAREGDETSHGGQILEGSGNVKIGGKPAARMLDKHLCNRHGVRRIENGSRTVKINGRPAARKDDICNCDALTKKYGDAVWIDSDGDGTKDTIIVMAGLGRLREEGYTDIGPLEVGAQVNFDLVYANAKGQVSTDSGGVPGGAFVFDAEAGVAKGGLVVLIGPDGDQGQNPYGWVSVQPQGPACDAGADLFAGDAGSRQGGGAIAKVGCQGAGVTVSGGYTIPIPLTDLTIEISSSVMTSAASSPGGEVGLQGYWDTGEERFNLYGILDIALGLGAGDSGKFSIGKKRTGSYQASTNVITAGLESVQVGG